LYNAAAAGSAAKASAQTIKHNDARPFMAIVLDTFDRYTLMQTERRVKPTPQMLGNVADFADPRIIRFCA
jgi:hypothetical protein